MESERQMLLQLSSDVRRRDRLFLTGRGAVITPAMDHTMSMQPASMMGPLTQQMNHMSLGTTGTGVVTDATPQTVAPSSQDASGQQQPLQVENANKDGKESTPVTAMP
ncbi:hypothetical protein JZ751_007360 [Albula glossodonta]|uniref:Uncharacterized protein n=1 Tax=Albula glossodonta TaxID=121402 RepID=A0A8T2N399_9TELE|nr:hypothetical protein JZ751_007360 [Albula glossodonta]